jgi:TonB-linked SusC/RagA family outer membrane protein
MVTDMESLNEVVVTALGITREKRSLGYATQELDGEDVDRANRGNVTNAISGKIAGVQVRRNTTLGGSSNVIIRGNTSLTGDNQPLYVIDGVPVDNSNYSSGNNSYDYGNAASDINPDDIESMNVLKGAAATALYGSRAANGAIVITTKSGAGTKGIGVTINSGVTWGTIDKSTFPKFQQEYGGGYGRINGPEGNSYFNIQDMDGDGQLDLVAPFTQYGGFGAPYDPDLLVYQWSSVYPQSPNYMEPTPWVAPDYGPIEMFQDPLTFSNAISLSGNTKGGTYRLSYSKFTQEGIVPNSNLDRNNFSLNSSFELSEKLNASASANYSITDVQGRTEGGVGGAYTAIMTNLRQYWQPNIDFMELRELYELTGENLSQFPGGSIDNPFYVFDQNRQADTRNRFIGNGSLEYSLLEWLNIVGRASIDTYSFLQEERQNTLIRIPSHYNRRDIFFQEVNYDLMLNYNKDLSDKLNISGVLGTNIRRTKFRSIYNSTNGGLIVEGLYAISNSLGIPPAAQEAERNIGVDGYYGLISLGYDNMLYVDVTGRNDRSSTLPSGNNSFFYPSIATSFIFSNLIDSDVLSFGKLRLNYAEVGNSAPALSLMDVLEKPTPFGSTQLYSVNNTKNNPALKPENTTSLEAGLETSFFGRRLGLNVSVYQTNTENQIMPVVISPTTGYTRRFVNAGEVKNRGVEIQLTASPIVTENFRWKTTVNWATNSSEIVSLYEGVENLQLYATGSHKVTLNARVGQPYGVWYGSDFEYFNGQKMVNQSTGVYEKTATSDQIIGKMLPDWNGGIDNSFTYKNLSFGFLIDFQKGGDIFSSDMAVGSRNGLYSNTTGTNELGNLVRSPIENGGGILLEGIAPDGSPNTVRTSMMNRNHALGHPTAPDAMFMYDASYVKLREVILSYNLPSSLLTGSFFEGAEFSLIGSNLWIIHKNVPYADPEAGLISGNVQGHQQGVYPATRDLGFNVRLQF